VVTDEGVVTKGVASGLGELVPDVEPLTVVLVDLRPPISISTEEMRA
jgi:Fe-S-cluster formation regulator IscX/YfhJ